MSSNIKNKEPDRNVAAIKFLVGLEKLRTGSKKIKFLDFPDWFPPVYNGHLECDMAIGPCSCGAGHFSGERRQIRWE